VRPLSLSCPPIIALSVVHSYDADEGDIGVEYIESNKGDP